MEVRERGHSPPFWASSSNASNPSPSSPYSSCNSTQSGIRPWVMVLVFSIVALLFLPYILSSSSKTARFNLSIKSGWDVLNLCLVVFAILCGVLGRIGERSGPDSGSYKQPENEWRGYMNQMEDVNRTAAIRRLRSSSSYPDLRHETDVWGQNRMPDDWRFFDDAELYRTRRPVQLYGVLGSSEEERECKTIPVDTERFPQTEPVENEIHFEEGNMESGASYEEEKKVREAMVARRQMRSLEALPKWEEVENEPMAAVGRRRRRSLERFPSIKEAEKETHFQEVEVKEEEEINNRQMVVRRGRNSIETFPVMNEIEEETKVEEKMVEKEPQAVVARVNSSESFPEVEEIEKKDTDFEENVAEKPPLVVEVTPPPPPPPPPPPSEKKVVEECRKHKRSGSGGGAKDLASAIALFYHKQKKGNKSKRKEKHETSIESNPNLNSVTESNCSPSTAPPPPPPPPPPPASIFQQLFSNKKGGNKSRKIHSLSQSAPTYSSSPSTVNIISTPPPPPPPPPHQKPHWSTEDQIASLGYRRIEHTKLYEHRRGGKLNLSRYANYPLPPRSPLPPPPPSPPPVCETVSESKATEEQRIGNVAVFCASPDVNDKADLFIKRFRDGLKLEKINSIREKDKRKEGRQEKDEKFGGQVDEN